MRYNNYVRVHEIQQLLLFLFRLKRKHDWRIEIIFWGSNESATNKHAFFAMMIELQAGISPLQSAVFLWHFCTSIYNLCLRYGLAANEDKQLSMIDKSICNVFNRREDCSWRLDGLYSKLGHCIYRHLWNIIAGFMVHTSVMEQKYNISPPFYLYCIICTKLQSTGFFLCFWILLHLSK